MAFLTKPKFAAVVAGGMGLLSVVVACGSPENTESDGAGQTPAVSQSGPDGSIWRSTKAAAPTAAPSVTASAAAQSQVKSKTISGSIDIKDIDGYTATATYQLPTAGSFAADPTNSKPGQTLITQQPGVAKISVTNTTPSRVYPHSVHLAPMALYEVGSSVCMALPSEDQISDFSDKYCVLYIGEPQSTRNGIAPKAIGAGQTMSLTTDRLDTMRGATRYDPLHIATIDEALEDEFLAALRAPVAVVLALNIGGVEMEIDEKTLCTSTEGTSPGTAFGALHVTAGSPLMCSEITAK